MLFMVFNTILSTYFFLNSKKKKIELLSVKKGLRRGGGGKEVKKKGKHHLNVNKPFIVVALLLSFYCIQEYGASSSQKLFITGYV